MQTSGLFGRPSGGISLRLTHCSACIARTLAFLTLLFVMASGVVVAQTGEYSLRDSVKIVSQYRGAAERIIKTTLSDSSAWNRLALFCDTFGPRLSGSAALERSIDWIVAELKAEGFDSVFTQDVTVPHWIRGAESCRMTAPVARDMAILGLGGSIGTPAGGIEAEVVSVRDFEELRARADEVAGKIVLFNAEYESYSRTVAYRFNGAVEAAKAGAIASLVRSVGPFSMQTPHTGVMQYVDTIPRIPHAAVTIEDALMIQRWIDRGKSVRIHLNMEARYADSARSRNIIAQINGGERPDEILVFGGHIDSWDVGSGAMDDAGGCFAAWRSLSVLKQLNLRPRRTVRLVMWTNEENGLQGARTYADEFGDSTHILALESDGGVFAPTGFGFTGAPKKHAVARAAAALLTDIAADSVRVGGGGADVSQLNAKGVDMMGLEVDMERYFWYHHTHADTPDKLDPHEMNQCAAAMAVMMYVMADIP